MYIIISNSCILAFVHFKIHPFFLCILSALLLAAGWQFHFSLFIFFGFVPLLIVEDNFTSQNSQRKVGLKLFGWSYFTFLLWNLLVTWWIVYASLSGAILAFVCNALLMSIVFLFFSSLKNKINQPWAIWLLIPIWMAWEHGHTIWDLTWTWLTLGNVLSFNEQWVQWFEYTGVSGGTLWILIVNILVFETIKLNKKLNFFSKPILKMLLFIILPILFSYSFYFLRKVVVDKKIEVVILQPNVDPYNVKFTLDYRSQFVKMLGILKNQVNKNTDYLVLPETFITENLNEETINEAEELQWFRDSLLHKFPNLQIIAGGNTYLLFDKNQTNRPATAREDDRGFYYDVYNTALQIDSKTVQIYHKSKLVPGVERMPFPALFKPLEKLAIDLGGTMGSLGVQENRSLLIDNRKGVAIAPVVCYESIFADYMTEYIRLGANFIFIITNDGWWDNTPGYIHHLNYAKLRAIENRRQIARCANTGISCFIDEFGTISQPTTWWEESIIKGQMKGIKEFTFFSKFGDILSYSACVCSILLVFMWIYLRFKLKI